MKKVIISLATIASFGLFINSASATDKDPVCMGSACAPTSGGNHKPKWNNPGMAYQVDSHFGGDLNGESTAHGRGNGPKHSSSYALGEQNFATKADVEMTEYRSGTACNGSCDQNKAVLAFKGEQFFNTGAMQSSEGTSSSGARVDSHAHGHFDGRAKHNWD